MKKKRNNNFDYLYVVRCKGATCVSMNKGINRYYADGLKSKRIKAEVFRYNKELV